MQIVEAKVRKMSEELKRPTDEIRISYNFGTSVQNITLHPAGDTQNPHFHYTTEEHYMVIDGSLEFLTGGRWTELRAGQGIRYEVGEKHNVRSLTKKYPVSYPGAGSGVTGVSVATRIIPPYLDVAPQEVSLLLGQDWWHADYDPNSSSPNPQHSPILRADEVVRRKFYEILERNRRFLS